MTVVRVGEGAAAQARDELDGSDDLARLEGILCLAPHAVHADAYLPRQGAIRGRQRAFGDAVEANGQVASQGIDGRYGGRHSQRSLLSVLAQHEDGIVLAGLLVGREADQPRVVARAE